MTRLFCLLAVVFCVSQQLVAGDLPAWAHDPMKASATELEAAFTAAGPGAAGDPVRLLLNRVEVVIAEDGSIDRHHLKLYKILSDEDLSTWDTLYASWQPWFQNRPDISVRILNGKDERLLETADFEADQEAAWDGFAAAEDFVISGGLPDLAVGTIVVEKQTVSAHRPSFAKDSLVSLSLSEEVACAWVSVAIDAPSDDLFDHRFLNLAPQGTRLERDGRQHFEYLARNLPAQESDSPEIGSYSRFPKDAILQVSTATSWATIAKAYDSWTESLLKDIRLPKPPANLILKGQDIQTTMGLSNWLSTMVARTDMKAGKLPLINQQPMLAIDAGRATVGDKALILVGVCRELGIDAKLVLVQAVGGTVFDRTVPNMGLVGLPLFNHVLVYLPESDFWMDPSIAKIDRRSLPGWSQSADALVIAADTTALIKTPEVAAQDNPIRSVRRIQLADQGMGTLVEDLDLKGLQGSWFFVGPGLGQSEAMNQIIEMHALDSYLTHLPKPSVYFARIPAKGAGGAEKARLQIAHLEVAQTIGNRAMVLLSAEAGFDPLPEAMNAMRIWLEKAEAHESDRGEPALQLEPYTYDIVYDLQPPEGFVLSQALAPYTQVFGEMSLTRQFQQVKDRYRVSYRFHSGPRVIAASAFREAYDGIFAYRKRAREPIYFVHRGELAWQRGQKAEAIQIFRDLVASHPNSAVHLARLADILLRDGQGASAREVISKAVALDATSDLVQTTRAKVLLHDLQGAYRQTGWDRQGVVTALEALETTTSSAYDSILKQAFLDDHKIVPFGYRTDAADSDLATVTAQILRLRPSFTKLRADVALLIQYSYGALAKDLEKPSTEHLASLVSLGMSKGPAAMDAYLASIQDQGLRRQSADAAADLLLDLGNFQAARHLFATGL